MPSDRKIRILEIGCGYGALLASLKSKGYEQVEGIDTSKEQVAVAHRLGIPEVRCADLLPAVGEAAPETYDVVIAFDVLEHFDKSELFEITEHLQRILKPGGRLVVHVPNAEAIFSARVRYGDLTHELAFTAHSFRQLALTCRFSKTDVFEDLIARHGVVSTVRSILWGLVRCVFIFILGVETGDLREPVLLTQNMLAICWK